MADCSAIAIRERACLRRQWLNGRWMALMDWTRTTSVSSTDTICLCESPTTLAAPSLTVRLISVSASVGSGIPTIFSLIGTLFVPSIRTGLSGSPEGAFRLLRLPSRVQERLRGQSGRPPAKLGQLLLWQSQYASDVPVLRSCLLLVFQESLPSQLRLRLRCRS